MGFIGCVKSPACTMYLYFGMPDSLYAKKNLQNFVLKSDAHCSNTWKLNDKLPCNPSNFQIPNFQNNSIKFISVKLFINKLPIDFRQLSLTLFEKKLKRFLLKSCFYSIDWFLASSLYYMFVLNCGILNVFLSYQFVFIFLTSSFLLILQVRIIHWLWWLKYFCSRTKCFYYISTFFQLLA